MWRHLLVLLTSSFSARLRFFSSDTCMTAWASLASINCCSRSLCLNIFSMCCRQDTSFEGCQTNVLSSIAKTQLELFHQYYCSCFKKNTKPLTSDVLECNHTPECVVSSVRFNYNCQLQHWLHLWLQKNFITVKGLLQQFIGSVQMHCLTAHF